ncbi:CcdB family protein [Plastoroseomonas arctica]|uniref:Toxin CcdB n=1 Tax=Plastoroseomonas arctica TaxID=1509237 RepID=A0AAF1KUM3_9PROT|nr:CcdB family protein [Plastoroseomonas arctica]MBR0656502.1 plasmid maintenance protein CcdB [Plastoroseomonas arctica]
MPRFALHRLPDAPGYLLDVQSNNLDMLPTRIVVPLVPEATSPRLLKGLTPVFDIEGERLLMVTYQMASMERRILGPILGDLSAERDRITAALDLLLTGF